MPDDEDLHAPLSHGEAHEVAWRLTFFLDSPGIGDAITMSYVHYTRSNDMDLDLAALGWSRPF